MDAIFSNAVFHWIPDHDRLFARLHAALKPGGRLVAQCGGRGNVASLGRAVRELVADEPFAGYFDGYGRTWNFAGPEETAERLLRLGFEQVETWLEDKRVQPEEPLEYLRTVTLGPHLARLPEDLHDRFVRGVAAEMGEPLVLDYVRLNIHARRPA